MTYKLFLDDERWPKTTDWLLVRSSHQAINAVQLYGMPNEIAFDHDLGGPDTAMHFIWWIVDNHYDNKLEIPVDFKYTVHSQNPIGAANIKHLMDGFLTDIGLR